MQSFIMRALQVSVLLAVVLVQEAVPVDAQSDTTWFGTWRLDSVDETSPYKRVVFRMEPYGERIRVRYDMVGMRGGRTHMEWVGAFDSRDYSMAGVDYVLTNAYSLIDSDSYEIVVKVDGHRVARTRASVSEDGQWLTATTIEQDEHGNPLTTTSVYRRQ